MKYYLIKDQNRIGKVDHDQVSIYDKNQGWVPDNDNILKNRLDTKIAPTDLSFMTPVITVVQEITESEAQNFINPKKQEGKT